MLYEIQPTGPAHRLATQQVGYDQKGKSAVQRRRLQQRRLQQHSQYHCGYGLLYNPCKVLDLWDSQSGGGGGQQGIFDLF